MSQPALEMELGSLALQFSRRWIRLPDSGYRLWTESTHGSSGDTMEPTITPVSRPPRRQDPNLPDGGLRGSLAGDPYPITDTTSASANAKNQVSLVDQPSSRPATIAVLRGGKAESILRPLAPRNGFGSMSRPPPHQGTPFRRVYGIWRGHRKNANRTNHQHCCSAGPRESHPIPPAGGPHVAGPG